MNKLVLAGLLGLAACFTPQAHAQVFFTRPPTTPPTRPFSTDPRYNLYGPLQSTYGLFPQGVPPAGATSAFGAAYTGRAFAAVGDQAGTGVDFRTPAVTGHPTRFAAYAGYFSNQGGGFSAVAPSTTPPSRITPSTTQLGVVVGQGSTPPSRGRSSSTPRR